MPVAEPQPVIQLEPADRESLDFLRDTTVNVTLDGYYGYNFNRPVGGINLLRSYDVSSNSFSLNQAAIVIENATNLAKGKRYGLRLDLQYGQATETVQGNAANEPRPQVYRPVWQAYGTYVFDIAKGLTVDFGKFASALGYETNYTKDNYNYSRSYFFNFLPFYHMGVRANYQVSDRFGINYWVVNGTQQSEAFKSAYASRAGIEGTISQGTRGQDLRRSRYRGFPKTRLMHFVLAAALNFMRVAAWLAETPRAHTRRSAFAALAPGTG